MATPSRFLLAALLSIPALVHADGPSAPAGNAKPVDPVIQSAQDAIQKRDWLRAQSILQEGLARDANNAEYHNLFAYSTRKGPNPQMDVVFQHYGDALRIDPKHRGAHEYIGEAYLMVGDLPRAKQHLAVLDKLCTFGCEEYSDLKKAVANYEASHKP